MKVLEKRPSHAGDFNSTLTMLANISSAAIIIALFVLEPLVRYLWDPKKLRRFPNRNWLSGITNFGYIIESCYGFRSRRLHEIHQRYPVVRVGPDSLSFSTPEAIRAIYGHSSQCIKGDMYSAPAQIRPQ